MLAELILPLAIIMGAVLCVVVSLLSRATRFVIAAALGIPQVFIAPFPIPLAEAWVLAMGVALALDGRRAVRPPATWATRLLVSLVVVTFISLFWSPDRAEGVNLLLRLITFTTLLVYGTILARDPNTFGRAMWWAAPWIAIQSGLTILFRASPEVEEQFLRSSGAMWLIGSTGRNLYQGIGNNVIDPAKAGGLIVNGNAASLLLGVSVLACLFWHHLGGGRYARVIAVLALMAVFATGSKTGISLAVSILPMAILFGRATIATRRLFGAVGPLVLALAFLWAPSLVARAFPTFVSDSVESYATRDQLWSVARELFSAHPLRGLGIGGWKLEAAPLIGRDDWPPHNLVIAAWANSGIVAAIITVLLFTNLLVVGWRSSNSRDDQKLRSASAYAAAGILWVFVHGMGDNTSVYGEPRSMFLVALLASSAYGAAKVVDANGGSQSTDRTGRLGADS